MNPWRMLLLAGAIVGLLAVPMASAGTGGTDRPFEATLAGAVTFAFPDSCPSSGCDEFTTLADLTGEASHLGRVVVHMSHHPYDLEDPLDGEMTMTAANGDKLYGVYDYGPEPLVATFTGGTGRFAHASGTVVITYEVIPQFQEPPCRFEFCLSPYVPWPWSGTMTGTISY